MSPLKVVQITGSRELENREQVHQRLWQLKPDVVITGMAKGPDQFAWEWAKWVLPDMIRRCETAGLPIELYKYANKECTFL